MTRDLAILAGVVEGLSGCPFCGGDASMSYSASLDSPEPKNRMVECDECGSSGPYVPVKGDDAGAQRLAIDAWNTRATLQQGNGHG